MNHPAYAVARTVAPTVAEHLQLHRAALPPSDPAQPPFELLPTADHIEALIDTAFWASVRREEGFVPKISLAFLRPLPPIRPLMFEQPLPLEPSALTRLAAAVEQPGIHLGVWPADDGQLAVWGTTHLIPPFCFVVEVIGPGLLVLKHRPRHESRKFVNVAVLEGDRIKIVDERASLIADCPALLTSMLGSDLALLQDEALNIQVLLALSMRRHGRGGILLVVPSDSDGWRESIVHPIRYAVRPTFRELADILPEHGGMPEHEWMEAVNRAIDALAGLTAVDGATVMTDRYELHAFGAKIGRRDGGAPVEEIVVTEPIVGGTAERMHPGQLGGTRHLAAAQFVHDQPEGVALVASQDGRFTIFAWSPCDGTVHAHRVEVLLL
ncbi:MAG: putative sensor domain DACNV-containing protein [Vicinamibacterales bacterium]